MNNKEKEAQILEHLAGVDAVSASMNNRTLADEYVRRVASFRGFVLNPGMPYENPATPEPNPPGTHPIPQPWGMDELLYNGKDFQRQVVAFNMLYRDHGEDYAMSYLVHNPHPYVMLSNEWRQEHPDGTWELNQYITNAKGHQWGATALDGSKYYPDSHDMNTFIVLW